MAASAVAIINETPQLATTRSRETSDAEGKVKGNFTVDKAILDALPKDVSVLSAYTYGSSAWSVTARINCLKSDMSFISYFVKCVENESGKDQLGGEFEAMSELYKTKPNLVPKPIAWGRTAEDPTYFFLCEYLNISDRLPDPAKLAAQIADLHKSSVSPTGKFGFHVPTYDGKLPQITDWDNSWPLFFSKLLAGILKLDVEINGPWDELEDAAAEVISAVVPRLLGALEADGRKIKPCLIHGDLWEGNIGTDLETGDIYIFDACSYYAHNEMEIGMWRTEHHRLKAKAYRREYLRNFEPSEPVNEWDDRRQALEDFQYLIDKFTSASGEDCVAGAAD